MQDIEKGDLHDEHNRWSRYVASLEERIARGEMTASQCQVFRRIWDRARDIFPKLRYPSVGCTSEGRLHLGWSFTDIPGITFTIDIERDGRIEWFFRNLNLSAVLGTDEDTEYDIADETLNLLAPFQK